VCNEAGTFHSYNVPSLYMSALRQKSLPSVSAPKLLGNNASLRGFRQMLLEWYSLNARDLPWRDDRDPYRVWLSEIMLQQTRVAVVIEYYRRFLQRFPTVEALAKARVSSVLAAWSGLGYYRRARALHAAAKFVVAERDGRFPPTAKDLQLLPGVGRYTAAAVASIAFEEPVAVVDGNVERVLQRLFGRCLDTEGTWQRAEILLSRSRPGDFNQAMMELGATICLPRDPKCLVCPVVDFCVTRGQFETKATEQRKKKEICYVLNVREGNVFLLRRPKTASLMPGMWELPEIPANGHKPEFSLRHSITVTDYVVHVVRGNATKNPAGRWLPARRAEALPLTGLTRKILRTAKVI